MLVPRGYPNSNKPKPPPSLPAIQPLSRVVASTQVGVPSEMRRSRPEHPKPTYIQTRGGGLAVHTCRSVAPQCPEKSMTVDLKYERNRRQHCMAFARIRIILRGIAFHVCRPSKLMKTITMLQHIPMHGVDNRKCYSIYWPSYWNGTHLVALPTKQTSLSVFVSMR